MAVDRHWRCYVSSAFVDRMPLEEVSRLFARRREMLRRGVETMPTHEQFLARNFQKQPVAGR